MSDAYHTQDLLKKALKGAGEVSTGTSQYHELALSYMNTFYEAMLGGANEFEVDFGLPWSWARNQTPKSIVLLTANESGTVGVTQGSAAATFSVAPAISMANRYLKISNVSNYYLITAHTAGDTAFTLETSYIDSTNSSAAFMAIPIVYDLGANILRLVEPLRAYGNFSTTAVGIKSDDNGKVFGMDLNRFRQEWPLHEVTQGIPTRFATRRRSEVQWLIEVNRYPSESTKVDLDFIGIPDKLIDSDTSVPIVPYEQRMVLAYATSHHISMSKKNLETAKYYYDLTKAKLMALTKAEKRQETHTGGRKGELIPRQEQLSHVRREFYR